MISRRTFPEYDNRIIRCQDSTPLPTLEQTIREFATVSGRCRSAFPLITMRNPYQISPITPGGRDGMFYQDLSKVLLLGIYSLNSSSEFHLGENIINVLGHKPCLLQFCLY